MTGAPAPPAGVSAASVLAVLARLRRVPDAVRRYTATGSDAWLLYRLDEALLEYMRGNGLAFITEAGEFRYERTDLMNIAMQVGSSAAARAARRFWAAGCRRPPDAGPAEYEITYSVACPAPGHGPSCTYRMILPDARRVDHVVAAGAGPPVVPGVRVAVAADWPPLPPAARDLLNVLDGIEFTLLPEALHGDVDFVRRSGLSDCWGTTAIIVAEGRRRGLPVRASYGLTVVAPYSMIHNWAEFRVADRWVPMDPLLVNAMIGWGVLDSREWNRYRSPGSIFHRITEEAVDLVTHDGGRVSVAFPTRRLPPAGHARG